MELRNPDMEFNFTPVFSRRFLLLRIETVVIEERNAPQS